MPESKRQKTRKQKGSENSFGIVGVILLVVFILVLVLVSILMKHISLSD